MNSVSTVTNCAPFWRAQNAATAALSVIRLIAEGYTIENAGAEAPRRIAKPQVACRYLLRAADYRGSRISASSHSRRTISPAGSGRASAAA
jgi:hypothetical protein